LGGGVWGVLLWSTGAPPRKCGFKKARRYPAPKENPP
jgi:hypothetical protein